MEKKNNLFKNIFFVLVAFCFLGSGILSLTKTENANLAVAENLTESNLSNQDLPSYFSAKEYLLTGDTSTENASSLVSDDIFLYYKEGGTSNYLSLSFLANGSQLSPEYDVYNYVYYPDLSNTSVFYFYSINSISLYVNGVSQEIIMGNYISSSETTFTNKTTAQPQLFEMVFNDNGTNSNEIKITDENGKVVEGVYSVAVNYTLYTCTDGGTTMNEEKFSDTTATLNYSFYVSSRDYYILNNRPNVEAASFDHKVSVSSLTNPSYAYYLYSNYSSEDYDSSTKLGENKIPYIEYDYTRFEVSILKELSGITSSETFSYMDTTSSTTVYAEGDDIANITIDTDNKTCRIYFTNVGNYTISLSAIEVVSYTTNNTVETRKYSLDGLTNATKKLMVYMFGYQANYTDVDKPKDENNLRQTSELKTYNFATGTFADSADITSAFVNDNNYSYSQKTSGTSFTATNVINYINNSTLTPVKTNQTPIKFSSNASLSTSNSYIFSTTKVSNAYSDAGFKLGGKTLYRASFTGQTDNTAGTYVYIIAYNFKNYYSTETTLSKVTTFYQIFYFEIVKDLPTIEIQTTTGTNVPSDTFVNQNVNIINSTNNDSYNKDVTIQIYAYDYSNNSYLEGFGGAQGISFDSLKPESANNENAITLEKSAFYTIRLYYTSEMTTANTAYTSTSGFFREQTFTIDKNAISNISARNVSEVVNSTNYQIVSTINTFSTNQSMILSWDEKASGAQTFAYYRFFPIVNEQYYTKTNDAFLSETLEKMLNYSADNSYMPVNSLLNMSTDNNNWLPYNGNTKDFSNFVSAEYVFSDSGLYLIDVYDEAGNHTVELFMIDTTKPLFAINDGESYKLTTSTMYITTASTLYWAKYKSIYIANFATIAYNSSTNADNVTEDKLKDYAFYKDYKGNICTDIFKVMYNKLFANDYMQFLQSNLSPKADTDETSSKITSYAGLYITVPINSVSYFEDLEHLTPTMQSGIYSQDITVDQEMTYRVTIRDLSNTKMNLSESETSATQYNRYYSAKQTIIVSHDSSAFEIKYTDNGEDVIFSSNNTAIETDDTDTTKKHLTTYLSPTSVKAPFTVSFIPTISDEDLVIQVSQVTIKYYPYEEKTIQIGDVTYHFYGFSSNATESVIYNFETDGASTTEKEDEIRLNSENITTAGKYKITRTYHTESGYTYKENDYYERTFVLYVDRNQVITNAELASDYDASGNSNGSHLESFVGGDVFVSMYDNNTNASLVVTFPNSPEGNSNGSSLYNNGTVKSILTTNMLPVKVYVPQYKYTNYARMITTASGYDFEVLYNSTTYITKNVTTVYTDESLSVTATFTLPEGYALQVSNIGASATRISYNDGTYYVDNNSYTTTTYTNENLYREDGLYIKNNQIDEYVLYAELYKNGTVANNIVAKTSTNWSSPTLNSITTKNGFLEFYKQDGSKLEYLSEAGTYYVQIYQGYFASGESSSITFCFDVEQSAPDFEVRSTTGSTLNSSAVSTTDDTKPNTIYYTNQSTVNLIWDAGSTYIAEIDIDQIKFITSTGYTYTTQDAVFSKVPELSGSSYIATLDLEQLSGVYQNNGYVDITMQYKNHDSRFYSKVTKRIYVDLSAPNTNISNLVTNSTSGTFNIPITTSALRTYYTAKMRQTSALDSTSYNISNSTGTFAYYSYSVTADYLTTLKNTSTNETSSIYVRKFVDGNGDNTKYTSDENQETSPTEFLTSKFELLTNVSTFDANCYYEIVEMDLAGNMTIYTIYVLSYTPLAETDNNGDTITTNAEYNSIITYLDSDLTEHTYSISDYNQVSSYSGATNNIYAKTGFSLENINFFGDKWAQIKLTTLQSNGFSSVKYIMLTPWDEGYAYVYTGSEYERVLISNLIDGTTTSRFKNSIAVYNRQDKSTSTFYINIRNTSLVATLTNNQDREYIRFTAPTDSDLQNTTYASTFVTYLQVEANGNIIYSEENPLGFASLWTSNNNILVTNDTTTATLTFEINPELGFENNIKIVYTFRDNYGTEYKEIHLYKETIIAQELSSEQDLYSYYDSNGGRLYYITKDGFKYSYNPIKYQIAVYDLKNDEVQTTLDNATCQDTKNSSGYTTTTISTTRQDVTYNDRFALVVSDASDPTNIIKTIYFNLYDELPTLNTNQTTNNSKGQFKIEDANGNVLTNSDLVYEDNSKYYSEIRILYSNADTFIPVKYSISQDKQTWTEINSGTRIKCQSDEMEKYYLKVWYDETYLKNEMGTTEYVFGNVPNTETYNQIYVFNLSSLTSTYWIEKTVDGTTTVVSKSNTSYKTSTGKQYTNHYIVNLSYTDKNSVEIKTNEELGIRATLVDTFTDSSTVTSELYLISNETATGTGSNIPSFKTNIVITYIPSSDNFVEEFYTYNLNGIIDSSENLTKVSSKSVVIPESSSISRIELMWTKYYGISQNTINITLTKDGTELSPIVYTKTVSGKQYNYVYLTHSGKYTISLQDSAGNKQKFNKGNAGQTETLSFIFLKDVPFTVTYTNPETNEFETSLPIKQAVYNGTVTISIDKTTRSEFYSLSGYPVISATKNGVELDTSDLTNDTNYTFSDPGYYEISFTATSNLPDIGTIRKETYAFTILNANEYKYSYIYNGYSNYYVERVVKDDEDITDILVQTLDVPTTTINGKTYLSQLPLSYLDEKTGAGVYLITINSNDKMFKGSSTITSWTYKVTIQVGTAPIKISLGEGQETTSAITATFNQTNIYSEMGECSVKIVKSVNGGLSTYYNLDINAESTGETTATISNTGTYYIQIVSPSGNLLYSYKVVKNEPLNAAAIIAIVISVLVAIAAVFIIIRLRKRIAVK